MRCTESRPLSHKAETGLLVAVLRVAAARKHNDHAILFVDGAVPRALVIVVKAQQKASKVADRCTLRPSCV
jgi:hypothetical protein